MFIHANRRDLVELAGQCLIVAQLQRDLIGQAERVDLFAGKRQLFLR